MYYRERATGNLLTSSEVKVKNPNVSFPAVWTDAAMASVGMDRVHITTAPTPAEKYQEAVLDGAHFTGEKWITKWVVKSVFTEGHNGLTIEEQEAAAEAEARALTRSEHRCSARQARLALAANGSLAAIEAAIAASGEAAQIEWQYANEIERSSPLIAGLTAGLGWTEEDLDNLFETAMNL